MEKIEETVVVLDYMPQGRAGKQNFKKEAVAQVIGTKYFTLLEVVPKKDEKGDYIELKQNERTYIGKGERDKIHFIRRRIGYADLTPVAEAEVEITIRALVKEQEQRFVEFFNTSPPITTRQHQLELLPKVGKKLMREILDERKKGLFKDFAEIKSRVKNLPSPEELIIERVIEEIKGLSKYYIFSANPPQPEQERERRHGYRPRRPRPGYGPTHSSRQAGGGPKPESSSRHANGTAGS